MSVRPNTGLARPWGACVRVGTVVAIALLGLSSVTGCVVGVDPEAGDDPAALAAEAALDELELAAEPAAEGTWHADPFDSALGPHHVEWAEAADVGAEEESGFTPRSLTADPSPDPWMKTPDD